MESNELGGDDIVLGELVKIDWTNFFFMKTIINLNEIGFDFNQLGELNSKFDNSIYRVLKRTTHELKYEKIVVYEIADRYGEKYQVPERLIYRLPDYERVKLKKVYNLEDWL